MKRNSGSLKIGVGTPTILMIFVVLCMVILAVLSYQEADYNRELANKEKQYVESYYKAEAIAKQMCDELTQESSEEVSNKHNILITKKENVLSFVVEIDKQKVLQVEFDQANKQVRKWSIENKEQVE